MLPQENFELTTSETVSGGFWDHIYTQTKSHCNTIWIWLLSLTHLAIFKIQKAQLGMRLHYHQLTHSGESHSDGCSLANLTEYFGLAVLGNVMSHFKVAKSTCIVYMYMTCTVRSTCTANLGTLATARLHWKSPLCCCMHKLFPYNCLWLNY